MGSDDLFWKRKNDLKRKTAFRQQKKSLLIVCEGQKTEPNYFRSFCISSLKVEVVGTGRNTGSLVDYTIDLKEKEDYDQIWCVFDKDSFEDNQFNDAVNKAEKNKFRVAYSNESFELWYILHFEYLHSAIPRTGYISKLSHLLGRRYVKRDKDMYDLLLDKQRTAIRNSERLLDSYASQSVPSSRNPSTTVHLLVRELNRHMKKG